MTGRFEGKVALITGGTTGIGRATALAFAREGADVAMTDIIADRATETARLVEKEGGRALEVACDVSRVEDVDAALEAVVARFGRLDVAFNMAR